MRVTIRAPVTTSCDSSSASAAAWLRSLDPAAAASSANKIHFKSGSAGGLYEWAPVRLASAVSAAKKVRSASNGNPPGVIAG